MVKGKRLAVITRKIGFTGGVFDMFHIGHLNLIKNAKERCDYLIVGVNTDELVMEYKNKKPVVPLMERIQIIEALKYVDKVVPVTTLDKEVIWKTLLPQFNILFIGSDWKGTERWTVTEKKMLEYGVQTIYLPHTDGTTSTILREKLIDL